MTNRKLFTYVGLGIAAIIGIVILLSSWYIVNEGERGIYTRNGKFISVEQPGLGFKLPIIDRVEKVEIRNMRIEIPVSVYSLDTQQYTAKVSLNYEIIDGNLEQLYKQEGVHYASRRLTPLVETMLKEVAGKYSAQRTIQERDIFGNAVRDAVRDGAAIYGVKVTEVQITDINFSDIFEKAIEQAMLAKAKVEEERNILEQKRIQAETVVVEATAAANAQRERAKGEADAKRIEAEAESERIEKIGLANADAMRQQAEALRNNPELTAYTYALAAQKWDGSLPDTFVPGSALPIVNPPLRPSDK